MCEQGIPQGGQEQAPTAPFKDQGLLSLEPVVVIMGISNLLSEKEFALGQIRNRFERQWYSNIYSSVRELFDIEHLHEYFEGQGDYESILARSLGYMRFIGFSEEELSAANVGRVGQMDVSEVYEDYLRNLESEGVIDFTHRAIERESQKPHHEPSARERFEKIKKRKTIQDLDAAFGITPETERRATLEVLDDLMQQYPTLPPFEPRFSMDITVKMIELSHQQEGQ